MEESSGATFRICGIVSDPFYGFFPLSRCTRMREPCSMVHVVHGMDCGLSSQLFFVYFAYSISRIQELAYRTSIATTSDCYRCCFSSAAARMYVEMLSLCLCGNMQDWSFENNKINSCTHLQVMRRSFSKE